MSRVVHPSKWVPLGRQGSLAPLAIQGQTLQPIHYHSIASAQVKSCILLAGLMAEGTTVTEPALSRDHSADATGI